MTTDERLDNLVITVGHILAALEQASIYFHENDEQWNATNEELKILREEITKGREQFIRSLEIQKDMMNRIIELEKENNSKPDYS